MQASQVMNLASQSQATTAAAKTGRNTTRDSRAGKFGDIMNQEAQTQPHKVAHNQNRPPVQTEKPEDVNMQQDENSNIVLFPAITAVDATNQAETPAEKALRLLDAIAAILEGNQGNILNIKEIAPLLQELAQVMQEIPPQSADMTKLLPKLEALLEEVQARMPLNEEIADSAQKMPAIDRLSQIIGQMRGNSSPFENVSEEANKAPAEEPAAPLKPITGGEQKATTAEEDAKSQQQREPNQTAATPNQQQQFRVDMAPQRVFFADAQAAAGAAEPRFMPMTPESLFGSIIDRIVALPGADPHMEIALKPDHLGKLTINLSMGEQGLTAKIIASDEGVRNMLAAHINRLSETLAEKGIRVENVEIVYSPLADKQSDGQQSNREEQGKNNSYRPSLWGVAENPPLGWDNAYTGSPYTDEWGTSSVEYQA